MKSQTSTSPAEARLLIITVFIASIPLFTALASAHAAPPIESAAGDPEVFTDHRDIDRAVEQFTGFAIGEQGGARMPADKRLRLARCAGPLEADWHGRARTSVEVSCAGPTPWRIFVATRALPQAERNERVISRGDPVTVIVRGRGFTVQQSGEAMENGAIGDWIAVRMSARGGRGESPLRARIESPGLAVIQ